MVGAVPSMFRCGSAAVQPRGDSPGALAEDGQDGGQQQAADHDGVEEHGRGEAEAELLEYAVFAEHEGQEYADDDRRGGCDDAPGECEALADGPLGVAAARPLLVDARDEEDLVIDRKPEDDREEHHGDEGLDRALADFHDAVRASPDSKTTTITPSAAPIESRFMRRPCRGITSERNTTIRSSAESSTTTPMKRGSLWPRVVAKSTEPAVTPP